MKLEHSFTVPTGIDDAWKILLDIERIGPCMPGASVDSVTGDDFTGSVKVKLGPIGLTYKGKASFVEKDEAAHRAVIDARGKDARGNGTASAKITATLSDQGGGDTTVKVDTDLDITGKPAQFGRGVMVDVGNKLIGIFADNLAEEIRGGGDAAAEPAAEAPAASGASTAGPAGASTSASSGAAESESAAATAAAAAAPAGATTAAPAPVAAAPAAAPSVNGSARRAEREVEPINLLESAGPAVAKRLAPPIAAALLVVAFVVWRRRS